jgi:hypothetical protein
MPMSVNIDDLLLIIGSKEATIYELSNLLGAARKELAELKKPVVKSNEPKLPANVIPFPGAAHVEPTQ